MLGTINNRVYRKYEKESSKLKMIPGGAWTINLHQLNLNDVNLIIYETKKFVYSITANKAKQIGIKMFLGNENKLVIPLKEWIKTKKEI